MESRFSGFGILARLVEIAASDIPIDHIASEIQARFPNLDPGAADLVIGLRSLRGDKEAR